MTDDAIIDRILLHEGGFVDHPADRGGPTNYGITAFTLGAARTLGRSATREEVRNLTRQEAKAIYHQMFIAAPGFSAITDGRLRHVVVDDAVMSGPAVAIRNLQLALKVPADGKLGPVTRAAIATCDAERTRVDVVKARCLRYGQIVKHDETQRAFILGWLSRALSFL